MAEFYYRLVLAHKRTCDENNKSVRIVPYTYRETVSQMLTDKGYDLNGNRWLKTHSEAEGLRSGFLCERKILMWGTDKTLGLYHNTLQTEKCKENAAAKGGFQSKPPEYTAVAKPFPKGICEPARRKTLDQAKLWQVKGANLNFVILSETANFALRNELCSPERVRIWSRRIP